MWWSDDLRRRLIRGDEGVIDKWGDVVIDGQHVHGQHTHQAKGDNQLLINAENEIMNAYNSGGSTGRHRNKLLLVQYE